MSTAAAVPSDTRPRADNAALQLIDTAPSPGRMAVAIAGYPYSPRAALFDIVDNSIEAGARRIAVLLKNTGKLKNAIVIVDDGVGIPPTILNEVLRAGSRTESLYSANSLSRYGIGLKGAGFSLGHRVSFLTQYQGEALRRRSIDLDRVMEADAWLQDVREPNDSERAYFDWAVSQLPGPASANVTGTVIIIESLNIRSREVSTLASKLARSFGETYAKFLASNEEDAGLRIKVDDKFVSPVDPLWRTLPGAVNLYRAEPIELQDGVTLQFSAVSLPHPKAVDKDLEKQIRYTQENQGVYIYRNNRLIASGQTLGIFGRDFHLNAFRAELLYTTAADHHINVDVAKSAVNLSPEAKSKIQDLVTTSTRTADLLWRERDVLTQEDIQSLFDEANRLIAAKAKLLVKRVDPKTGKVTARVSTSPPQPTPATGSVKGTPSASEDVPYILPVDSLPGGVLYRPRFDGDVGGVVVDVNLAHPFAKAVFNVAPDGDGNRRVLRKAATATQQLLYVLGSSEYQFPPENNDLFEQFRKLTSLNLSAIVGD